MAAYKYAEISEQVRTLYVQGKTKKEISLTLDLDQEAVRYILYTQLNIKETNPRNKKGLDLLNSIPREKLNKIITLTNFGYNFHEVANDVDMSKIQVYRIIKEAKINNLIKKVV